MLNDVNMRVFEAAACGPLLLTNDLSDNGQAELLRDGVHLATYRDGEELLDKLRYYLRREALRKRIAAAGRAEVLEKHTYLDRMKTILAAVVGAISDAECGVRHAESTLIPSVANGPRAVPSRGGQESEAGGQMSGMTALEAQNEVDTTVGEKRIGTESVPSTSEKVDSAYFEFARPELLALVPPTARRVLDVECGAGRLGAEIKARQACEVVGIERDRAAAGRAAERLDQVHVGNVERVELPFDAGQFDCIVCGDVLEHLREPGRFLARAREWLAADGVLVASIPNERHHSVVSGLLAGNWTYEPTGLLDDTHRRFFTRRCIEELFVRCGYHVKQLGIVPGPGHDEWQKQGRSGALRLGGLAVDGLERDETEEFFVYQYLVVAEACRVGRVKRVPPSAETRPSPPRQPKMVGLASSAHRRPGRVHSRAVCLAADGRRQLKGNLPKTVRLIFRPGPTSRARMRQRPARTTPPATMLSSARWARAGDRRRPATSRR